jgi:hypothetical protein
MILTISEYHTANVTLCGLSFEIKQYTFNSQSYTACYGEDIVMANLIK